MKIFPALRICMTLIIAVTPVAAQTSFGPQGLDGTPHRRQIWLLPSPEPITTARAILFRPPGNGPFPLAVIAHASTQNALRRAQMPQPEYGSLATWFVTRGYAVLVPQRPGHGATGGHYLEDQHGCENPDYDSAGRATAAAIAAAIGDIRSQPFIRADRTVVVGHSAGGWGALALAASPSPGIAAIIAFAPGRGGHADDEPQQVCAPDRLIAAASTFGRDARIPVIWLVARNDSYFSPALSRQLADAFRAGGDKVDFRELPAFRNEGHLLAESDGGDEIYGATLDNALKAIIARPPRKR